jgi:hypothetical protein
MNLVAIETASVAGTDVSQYHGRVSVVEPIDLLGPGLLALRSNHVGLLPALLWMHEHLWLLCLMQRTLETQRDHTLYSSSPLVGVLSSPRPSMFLSRLTVPRAFWLEAVL